MKNPPSVAHLPAFPGWLAALGPGVVWMALAQGSGELIWWPYLMAKYGLGFLCLLIPACLLQYIVTFEIGRYTAMTGESIWQGFVRLSPAFAFGLWILMLISFLWFGAFASAGGTALAELTHWPAGLDAKGRSLFWAGVSIALFVFALLSRRKTYHLIEKVMWFVSISTLAGLFLSCLNREIQPLLGSFTSALFVSPGLPRPWDPADMDKLLTALTFAGLGGFWTLFYSNWILGKGIGMAASGSTAGSLPDPADPDLADKGRRWRNFLAVDTGIGVVGNILTTLMTCFLAYAILFPKGLIPAGWTIAVEQSRFFELSWGASGRALFLFISAAFLADTWLSTVDAVARVHMEMVRRYFFSGRSWNDLAAYRITILILTAVTACTMLTDQPGELIILSAIIGFVGTVIYTTALLILIHGPLRRSLPEPLKPGRLALILLTLSALVYGVLAVIYVNERFFKIDFLS